MGSEVYAYFNYEGSGPDHDELADLAAESGASDLPDTEGRAVARLDAETSVKTGEKARLWMDTSRIHLFHGEDGRALRAQDGRASGTSARDASDAEAQAPPAQA